MNRSKKWLAGLLAFAMLFLGVPSTSAQQQVTAGEVTTVAPGDLQLNLVSPMNDPYGQGIPVRLFNEEGRVVAQGTSDALGRVTLPDLQAGNYFLGFGSGRVPLVVSEGAQVTRLNIIASPAQLGLSFPTQLPDYAGGAGAAAGGTDPTVLWTVVAVGGVLGLSGLTVGIIGLNEARQNEEDIRDLEDLLSP